MEPFWPQVQYALPSISLLWLDKLSDLRDEIAKKQNIISKLKVGSKTFERDRVLQNLKQQKKYWENTNHILKQKNTIPVVVENPEELSKSDEGKKMNFHISCMLV